MSKWSEYKRRLRYGKKIARARLILNRLKSTGKIDKLIIPKECWSKVGGSL